MARPKVGSTELREALEEPLFASAAVLGELERVHGQLVDLEQLLAEIGRLKAEIQAEVARMAESAERERRHYASRLAEEGHASSLLPQDDQTEAL